MVGGALGSMVAPGIGTALGSQLGSWASGLFELELESMPQEQAEFEVAKRVVGLTAAAANKAALAPPMPGVSPEKLARAAITEAARDYAPGLFRMLKQSAGTAGGPSPSGLVGTRVPDMPSGMRRVPPGPGGRMPPGRRSRAFGGDFWDVPEEPSDADWGADGSVAFASAGRRRPTAGRWVRRGRRIVLLGI